MKKEYNLKNMKEISNPYKAGTRMNDEKRYETKMLLTQSEAASILKFLDRAHFDTFRSLAEDRDENEAYEMRDAFARVAAAIIADVPPKDSTPVKEGSGSGGGG